MSMFFVIPFLSSAQYITIDGTSIESWGEPLFFNAGNTENMNVGTNALFLSNSAGYIGIGTATPSYNLHVIGTGYFANPVFVATPTASNDVSTKAYADTTIAGGVGTGTAGQTMRHDGTNWVGSSLIHNSSTTIGIGTTSPANLLHVFASAPTNNVLTTLQSGTNTSYLKFISTGTNWQIGPTAQGFQFYNNDTSQTRVTITSGGNLGIGSATPTVPLDVVGNGVFTGTVTLATPTTGTHAVTRNYVDNLLGGFWVSSGSNIYSGNTGNVGIGTTIPISKLNVGGTIKMTGFQLGTTATAGYVLTTDANGVGTWQQASVSGRTYGGSVMKIRTPLPSGIAFTFESYSSSISSYFTCPTGYTLWSDSNARWYPDQNGNVAYFGACHPTTATTDIFTWKAYNSPAGVTCPTGYTKWSGNSYCGYTRYSSYCAYNGACYKGTPSSFTWETYTGHGVPTSWIACPSGYTAWYDANAQWYSSYSGFYDYTGSCYNASATNDVFIWKSNSVASVTCPSGYTKWNAGQIAYGPGNVSYTSGACYKGTPPSFTWELYNSYSPDTNITCPSGYTRWWGSTARYYDSNSYYNYNGACIKDAHTSGDSFSWFSYLSTDATTCPTGYTKWSGHASYYTYRQSSAATYSYACYKVPTGGCASCPSEWSSASCETVSINSTDINENTCYRNDTAVQTLLLKKKGDSQSLSCPNGWAIATSSQNIAGNTELSCYFACPSGISVPGAPENVSATPGGTQVTLSWTAPTGDSCSQASTYNVYRSLTSGSGFASIVTGVTSTSYIDTGRSGSTTYYYKISGTNSAGEGTQSSEISTTTLTATIFNQGYNSIPPILSGSNPCQYGLYCTSITVNGNQETCVDAQFTRLASWPNPQYKLIARMMNNTWNAAELAQIASQLGFISCTVANSGVSYAGYHNIGNGVWGSQPNGYAIGSATPIDCAWNSSSNVTLYDGQSGNWSFGSQPSQCAGAPTPPAGYLSECNNQNSTDYAVNITCTR